MTDGELKKRILDMRNSWCWCGGEIEDENDPDYRPFKTCKTKREPTKEEIKKALNDARQDFPRTKRGGSMPYLPLGSEWEKRFSDIEKWFLYWFGEDKK